MELIDILHVLRRRWWIVLVVMIACVGGAAAATLTATEKFRTSTRLIVSGASAVGATDEISQRQLATQRAVAYAQIASTPPAARAALERAESQTTLPSGPGLAVSVTASGDDPFLDIVVTDTNARRAAAVANSFVVVLPDVIKNLEAVPTAGTAALSTVSPAAVPRDPFSPRPIRNGLIGLAVGLVLGLASAFVRESLDRRLRDSDEVETSAGVNVLGVVPQEIASSPLPVETEPMSSRAEAYRKVRTNLSFTSADGMPRSTLITSSTSGEGKTTLATNLALACARTGYRVVLVDADLRRPMVAEYMALSPEVGLTSWLTGASSVSEVVQPFGDTGVDVIASGPIPSNPSELLGSERMAELLQALEETYDIVIVDAPPVLPVADGLVLAVLVQAVVLVAKVGDTTRDRLKRSRDAILKVQGNLVGVVPNAVVQREDSAYAYAYRYRSRGADSLKLYTKQARLPEIDESGRPLAGDAKQR